MALSSHLSAAKASLATATAEVAALKKDAQSQRVPEGEVRRELARMAADNGRLVAMLEAGQAAVRRPDRGSRGAGFPRAAAPPPRTTFVVLRDVALTDPCALPTALPHAPEPARGLGGRGRAEQEDVRVRERLAGRLGSMRKCAPGASHNSHTGGPGRARACAVLHPLPIGTRLSPRAAAGKYKPVEDRPVVFSEELAFWLPKEAVRAQLHSPAPGRLANSLARRAGLSLTSARRISGEDRPRVHPEARAPVRGIHRLRPEAEQGAAAALRTLRPEVSCPHFDRRRLWPPAPQVWRAHEEEMLAAERARSRDAVAALRRQQQQRRPYQQTISDHKISALQAQLHAMRRLAMTPGDPEKLMVEWGLGAIEKLATQAATAIGQNDELRLRLAKALAEAKAAEAPPSGPILEQRAAAAAPEGGRRPASTGPAARRAGALGRENNRVFVPPPPSTTGAVVAESEAEGEAWLKRRAGWRAAARPASSGAGRQ